MFLDYLYTLPNSTSGIDQIAKDTVSAVPAFAPLLLVFVWFLIFLGGSGQQRLRTGTADWAAWATVASLMTVMVNLILSVQTGFIRLDWLVYTILIAIASGVWLFLDRRVTEV